MRKHLLFITMALAACAVMCTFSACGGDNDRQEDKRPTTPINEEPNNNKPGNDGSATEFTVKTGCDPCHGKGTCPTCKGTGKGCTTCGGTGKHCDTCGGTGKHCDTCGGTGKHCDTCKGTGNCDICKKTGKCTTCKGSGKYCATCGGSGIHCDTCGGTGKWCHMCGTSGACSYCSDGNCNKCRGSGNENCIYCGGNGRCTTCGGLGWTGKSSNTCYTCKGSKKCYKCNGKGTQKCSTCYGSGKCRDCNGSRKCSTCHGNPVCKTCNGNPTCKSCYGNPACKACDGKGVCKACGGTTKCKSCGGTVTCNACGGTATCKTCGGTAQCKSCGGDGHCASCNNNDGKCKKCEGTGLVNVSSLSLSYTGGSQKLTILSNGSWKTSADAEWIKLSSLEGNGNTTLTLTADKNPTSSSRNGKVTFSYGSKNVTLSISQNGEPPVLTVSPDKVNFTYSEGSQSFTVTSNVSWTVKSDNSWCTVSPNEGANNGSVTVAVSQNESSSARNATVTIEGGGLKQTFTVSQDRSPYLSVNKTEMNCKTGGGTYTIDVESNVTWEATSNSTSWCKVKSGTGKGKGSVTLEVSANTTDSERSAVITISGTDVTPCTVNVIQSFDTTSVDIDDFSNDKKL